MYASFFALHRSITPTWKRSTIRHAIFSQTQPPRRIDLGVSFRCGSIGVKCLSQGDNDAFCSSKTKLRVGKLMVANLHSYPQPLVGMIALNVFPKNTAVRYAQFGHRTINLAITIWRSHTLS